jgi:DnaK suppressor protein
MAKKVKKPAAKKSVKSTNKNSSKPAVKKQEKKSAKPATKKAVKPAAKQLAKPTAKKAVDNKETKSIKSKPSEKKEKETKKSLPVKSLSKADKSLKSDTKKPKVIDEDLETEDLELGDDIDGLELDAETEAVEDDLIEDDEIVKQKPKRKGGRRRKDDDDDDHVFDSDSLIRKQPIKIDLNRQLIKKSQAPQPKPFVNNNDNRTRYSDKELVEFKELIHEKLKEAETDYDLLKSTLSNKDNHGTDDTSPTFKLLEDGSSVMSKEETAQLAARQEKYIISLRNALIRIQNKSYGVCRVTGKLIPKERLRVVPHATLGIDAKLNQNS